MVVGEDSGLCELGDVRGRRKLPHIFLLNYKFQEGFLKNMSNVITNSLIVILLRNGSDDLFDFIQRFFVFFIPGVIGISLLYYLNPHKDRHYYIEIFYMFIYSFLSYLLSSIAIWFLQYEWPSYGYHTFNVMDLILVNGFKINLISLLLAVIFAILIALLMTKVVNEDLIFNLAYKLNVTNRTSNGDVWERTMRNCPYVVVRDNVNKRIYYGQVEDYSDFSQFRELSLINVSVYSEESEFQYEAKSIYISREHNQFTVETYNYDDKCYSNGGDINEQQQQ